MPDPDCLHCWQSRACHEQALLGLPLGTPCMLSCLTTTAPAGAERTLRFVTELWNWAPGGVPVCTTGAPGGLSPYNPPATWRYTPETAEVLPCLDATVLGSLDCRSTWSRAEMDPRACTCQLAVPVCTTGAPPGLCPYNPSTTWRQLGSASATALRLER